jgi:hypothetical protein
MCSVLAAEFNRHRNTVDRYENLLRMVAFRYGAESQGITFVLYDELIALRLALVDDPGCLPVRAWAGAVASRLGERYSSNLFPTTRMLPSTVVGTDPVTVEFSREVFEERYRPAVSTVRAETLEVVSPVIPDVEFGRPYMFVIDDRNRMLIWSRPFTFEELVFGRNRATVAGIPVAHPMLVPDRLRASAAGEIVFIGRDKVAAVVVNNKSGHFRLPPSCAGVIRAKCATALGLDAPAIDIFVMGSTDGSDRPSPENLRFMTVDANGA